jgi:iron complex outermembrane recepter protein
VLREEVRTYPFTYKAIGVCIIITCLISKTNLSFAQTSQPQLSPNGKVIVLPSINVLTTRSEKKITSIPAAVTRTDQEEILTGLPQLTLNEGLGATPGVFFQNQYNFAQDLRVSIRGFGTRSSFGVRGVKILVDGIPQTLPDGQTQLDSIDPGMIKNIEILRGPSSSLYGNASGGIISITTEEDLGLGTNTKQRIELGQFGLEKYQLKLGQVSGPLSYRIYTSHLKLEGYRDHSATENSFAHGIFKWVSESNSEWRLSISNLYSPKADDPGALTKSQVESNPKSSNSNNSLFDAGERVKNTNFGLTYKKKINSGKDFFLTINLNHRYFENKLPFTSGGQVEFERLVPMFGIRSVINKKILGQPSRFIVGADFAHQRDDRKRFNNNNGIRGDKTLDRLEEVSSFGPYLRVEWQFSPRLELVSGIRHDHVYFNLTDSFLDDGDQSDSKTLSEWSGTLGSIFHWNDKMHFYTTVSTVFETPTITELANDPSGGSGFNSNLESQNSISYEVGLKNRELNGTELDLGLFFIQSRNELIGYELDASPGRTFYKNAGESRRIGFETLATYRPTKEIKVALSYTYSNFKFTEFDDDESDQSGNFIPGNPKHNLVLNVDTHTHSGWFVRGKAQYVSSFFVNNENTVKNNSYTTSSLALGRQGNAGIFKWSVFLGLKNLLNDTYHANTRINASSSRFFEPAPPLNIYGGISLSYNP